jgi:hypothetical protein
VMVRMVVDLPEPTLEPHTRAWRAYPCRVAACLRC